MLDIGFIKKYRSLEIEDWGYLAVVNYQSLLLNFFPSAYLIISFSIKFRQADYSLIVCLRNSMGFYDFISL